MPTRPPSAATDRHTPRDVARATCAMVLLTLGLVGVAAGSGELGATTVALLAVGYWYDR